MTLRDYLQILRERWKLVTIVVLVAVGLAVVITALTPKVYQAHTQLYVVANTSSNPIDSYQATANAQAQVSTYAQIVDSPDVLNAVRQNLRLATSNASLRSKISATAPSSSSLINLYVTDASAGQAASIANAASKAFAKAIESYSTPSGSKTPTVRLIVTDPAAVPTSPTTPNPGLNLVLGVFVGLLLGIALAVARETLNNRFTEPEALAMIAAAPLMGVIVDDSEVKRYPIATQAGGRSVRAENFRQLRANLQFADVDEQPRVIAVTSAVPGEGKTTVAINLASTLAEAGFTVCLVDTDLRRPTIADTLGLLSAVGLTSVLIKAIDLDSALQRAGHNLYLLASGPIPPNPTEILASTQIRDLVQQLLGKADYVVLDTAPLLPVADGGEVASMADSTLLVARHGETTETQVERAVEQLRRLDVPLNGVLLNRVPLKQWRSGRGYGYGAYQATDDAATTAKARPSGNSKRSGRTREAV